MAGAGVVQPSRTPWPDAFPDVVIHTTVRVRDAHPCYAAAKAGDADAALTLAHALIDDDAVEALRLMIVDPGTILLPVVADETTGFNAIPDAMAQFIGRRLALWVEVGGIVQTNKVGHTRAPAFQRLVTPATFAGTVSDATYVLVDDHVGLGGTLASLKGHIELNDGIVRGITTLTESRDARKIALRPATRDMLWDRHGEELETLWNAEFGYGIDCLTDIEAQNLHRQPSVAAIEDFLAQAAVEARSRGLDPAIG